MEVAIQTESMRSIGAAAITLRSDVNTRSAEQNTSPELSVAVSAAANATRRVWIIVDEDWW